MATALTYSQIEKTPGQPARLTRLPRIRVAQIVMDHLAHGWSVEEMCRQYPHLLPAEAHAAMLYYYDHEEEVNQEIRDELEEIEQAKAATAPSPFLVRMRAQGIL